MIDVADVYRGDELAGRLVRHSDRVEFSYQTGYSGDPVASTLPLSVETSVAPAGQLPAFFVGLLPEGRRLAALIRSLKVSADDEMSLLLAVGADTIGDVRVFPEGGPPDEPDPLVGEDDWTELDLVDLFQRATGTGYDRVGLPGAQVKASGRMISFPVSGVTGDVIVKLDPPEYRNLCANEAVILMAARAAGLRVPSNRMVTSGASQTGLVVARFDRLRDPDGVRRFPVEDGCQVLGRYPADKYNLDTVDVLRGLASRCTAPPIAAIQLFERFLFAYLAGDGDFHARNAAVWQNPNGLWEPTPVFDAVCTAVYGDTTLAGPLDGDESVREIGRRRMVAAAVATGINEKAAVMTLDRRVPLMADSIREALSGPVFSAFPHLPKVERMLASRADLLVG